MSAVWVVEFKHSLGWTPCGDAERTKKRAQERAKYWRKRNPFFQYRVAKFERAAVNE